MSEAQALLCVSIRVYYFRVYLCLFVSIIFRVYSCLFSKFDTVSIRVYSCLFVSKIAACLFVSKIIGHSCLFVSIRVYSCLFVSIFFFVSVIVDFEATAVVVSDSAKDQNRHSYKTAVILTKR